MKQNILIKFSFAFMAFLIWGSWAYYVNESDNQYSAVISGISQGTGSFVITLMMFQSVSFLYSKISMIQLKLILPAIITTSISGLFLILIHYCVGTDQIFKTIIPAVSVGFCFCLYVTYLLNHSQLTMNNNYE